MSWGAPTGTLHLLVRFSPVYCETSTHQTLDLVDGDSEEVIGKWFKRTFTMDQFPFN